MKKLFLFALILILNSCSRGTDNPTPTPTPEPTLILKTENLSFQDAPAIPQQMWLSTSSSNPFNIFVSTGKRTLKFNPQNNSWENISTNFYSNDLQWCNLIVQPSQFILFNGINNKFLSFNNYNGSWSSGLDANLDPVKSAGCYYSGNNNIAYFAGGSRADGSFSNKLNKIEINYPNGNPVISQISTMPESKETQIELINDKIYVIGGYTGTTSKRIDVYDLASNKWTFLGNMPYGFSSHATCVNGSKIWIVGNYNLTDQQLAYYNTATNEFVTVNSNIIPRRHANAEVINNKLYVFSGATDSSSASALISMQVANIN